MRTDARILNCKTELPLRFLACGRLVNPQGFVHMRRITDCHVLILVTEGTLHIHAGAYDRDVHPGEYLILCKGEEHFGLRPSNGRLSYFWLHFDAQDQEFEFAEQREKVADVETPPESVPYQFPETGSVRVLGRIAQLFRQLEDWTLSEEPGIERVRDYAVSLLLLELSHETAEKRADVEKNTTAVSRLQAPPPEMESAAEWIRMHYPQPFTVRDLAGKFGFQADYFSSRFKKTMGISVTEYTNRTRIRAAKSLLSDYDLKIKEAAWACGFSDEHYFARIFRQLEGITPTQYKESFARAHVNE